MGVTFQRLQRIGAGSFSVIHEATIAGYGRVAVKELISHLPDDVVRFRREVQIQSQLQHPNIVPILVSELDTNMLWFAMPLALSNMAREMPRLTEDRSLLRRVFSQILAGMEHAHEHKVIHRDLKPENILWFEESVIGISDFGLGKLLDINETMLTLTGQSFGSIAYMAPEQLESTKHADKRADIYALGKLLYKALTGDLHILLDITAEKIDPAYRELILTSTANNPEDRYQTVTAMREAFEAIP